MKNVLLFTAICAALALPACNTTGTTTTEYDPVTGKVVRVTQTTNKQVDDAAVNAGASFGGALVGAYVSGK